MSKMATELLKLQNSTNVSTPENSSTKDNEPLQVNEQYNESPIWIRGSSDHGFFATLGDFRICKLFESKEDLTDYLDSTNLTLILSLVTAMIETRFIIEKDVNNDQLRAAIKEHADKERNANKGDN